jgi:PAS domain S-box-containing protein
MPDTDGFELAAMIQEHPRFKKTAIIFISAVFFNEVDRLRGYEMGAVDYVSVPVIPEVLRAKVKVFVELYRKTHQLEQLNRNLEARVAERTAELAASTLQLRQAERLRSLALAAGQMGSWEWDLARGRATWDRGQHEIFGVDPQTFVPTAAGVGALIHEDDLPRLLVALRDVSVGAETFQTEFRARRPSGEVRWCIGVAAASFDERARLVRVCGVTVDITDRKRAEERQLLLAEEVDHRARNVVAVIQAIMRLTRAQTIDEYIGTLDGRIRALSTAHKLLAKARWEGADLDRLVNEEVAPYREREAERIDVEGPGVLLPPAVAQTLALALHELVTNAAKYGALSSDSGRIRIAWATQQGQLTLTWAESQGPKVRRPSRDGYGTRVIKGGIEGQLGGRAEFDWRSDGLHCTLSIPYKAGREPATRQAAPYAAPREQAPSPVVNKLSTRHPVLLVEDEPLISMMIADMLSKNGHQVDGPYSRFSEALAAAANNELQAGILDVNVSGEAVYPIAEALAKRRIPFVFVTGYGADSIDPRFNHIPVVQKPVELQSIWAALAESSGRLTQ